MHWTLLNRRRIHRSSPKRQWHLSFNQNLALIMWRRVEINHQDPAKSQLPVIREQQCQWLQRTRQTAALKLWSVPIASSSFFLLGQLFKIMRIDFIGILPLFFVYIVLATHAHSPYKTFASFLPTWGYKCRVVYAAALLPRLFVKCDRHCKALSVLERTVILGIILVKYSHVSLYDIMWKFYSFKNKIVLLVEEVWIIGHNNKRRLLIKKCENSSGSSSPRWFICQTNGSLNVRNKTLLRIHKIDYRLLVVDEVSRPGQSHLVTPPPEVLLSKNLIKFFRSRKAYAIMGGFYFFVIVVVVSLGSFY